jgi:ribosomal protein S3
MKEAGIGVRKMDKGIKIERAKIGLKSLIKKYKVSGYKLIISGRIRGRPRAKQMKISKGVVKMNNLTHYFQAKQSTIQTK